MILLSCPMEAVRPLTPRPMPQVGRQLWMDLVPDGTSIAAPNWLCHGAAATSLPLPTILAAPPGASWTCIRPPEPYWLCPYLSQPYVWWKCAGPCPVAQWRRHRLASARCRWQNLCPRQLAWRAGLCLHHPSALPWHMAGAGEPRQRNKNSKSNKKIIIPWSL